MKTCNDCEYFDWVRWKCNILLRKVNTDNESCIVFKGYNKIIKTEIYDIEPKVNAKIYADFMKGVK